MNSFSKKSNPSNKPKKNIKIYNKTPEFLKVKIDIAKAKIISPG